MRFTTNYAAVFRTYQAEDHFEDAHHIPFIPDQAFSPEMAWWMCSLARWAYRDNGSNTRDVPRAHLALTPFRELAFFARNGIHASLVINRDKSAAVLAFRGTSRLINWRTNLAALPLRNNAHAGFEQALDSIWPQLAPALKQLTCPVYVTGHSLGAALATLTARRFPVAAVYTLGCPPLGDRTLQTSLADLPIYRLINYKDFATRNYAWAGYHHVGRSVYLGYDHELVEAPDVACMALDQQRGVRPVTAWLNQDRRTPPLPETVTDHSPQNYVAGLARVCLGQSAILPDRQLQVAL